MSQELDPQIKEQFLSLPKVVQDIITDSGWQFTIRDIIKKFNLRIDQGGIIEQEVMFVMFGFEDADTFVENIQREAKLDAKVANELADEVARIIFAPLRAALMKETDDASGNTTEAADLLTYAKPEIESRDDILKQIEDPSEIPVAPAMPTTKQSLVLDTQITTETPTSKITNSKTPPATPAIPPMSSTSKVDPYREPIE